MALLSLQSAGTQMLKAFTVHFVGSPKGKFGEYKNLFCKVSYRHQQHQSPLAIFRSREITANTSILRYTWILLPYFQIRKLN